MPREGRGFSRSLGSCLLFLALCVLFWAAHQAGALAATLSTSASWDPRSLKEGGEVAVTVTLQNETEDITAEGVVLQREGTVLATVGDMAPGETRTASATLTLATEELGQPIPLDVVWGEDGTPRSASLSITVSKQNPTPSVKFTRKVSAESVVSGGEVVITYTVTNVGDVDITDISITDNFGTVAEKDLLAVGSNTWVATKTLNPTKAFATEPILTYNVGEYTYNNKADPDSITIGIVQPTMQVKLEADVTTLQEGEPVTLVGTLVNNGSVAFRSVSVKATNLGEIYTAQDLAVGATRSFSQKTVIAETTNFKLTVTAKDASGKTYTYTSNTVTVKLEDTPAPVSLELYATSDMLQLTAPTDVTFQLTMKNTGRDALEGIRVTDQEGRLVAEFQYFATGSQEFSYTIPIAEATNVVFTATVTDPSTQEEIRVSSQPIAITYNAVTPTLDPEMVTAAPSASPGQEGEPLAPADSPLPEVPQEDDGSVATLLLVLGIILAAIAAVGVILVIGSAREKKRRKLRRPSHTPAPSARPVSRPKSGVSRPKGSSTRPARGSAVRSRYDSPSARAARAGVVGAARTPMPREELPGDDAPPSGETTRFAGVPRELREDIPIEPLSDTMRFTALKADDWGDVDSDDLGTTLSGKQSFPALDLPLADDDIDWEDIPPEDPPDSPVSQDTIPFTPKGRPKA